MTIDLKVYCDGCNRPQGENDGVYCESCYQELEERVKELTAQIDEKDRVIAKLETEISNTKMGE